MNENEPCTDIYFHHTLVYVTAKYTWSGKICKDFTLAGLSR